MLTRALHIYMYISCFPKPFISHSSVGNMSYWFIVSPKQVTTAGSSISEDVRLAQKGKEDNNLSGQHANKGEWLQKTFIQPKLNAPDLQNKDFRFINETKFKHRQVPQIFAKPQNTEQSFFTDMYSLYLHCMSQCHHGSYPQCKRRETKILQYNCGHSEMKVSVKGYVIKKESLEEVRGTSQGRGKAWVVKR